MPVQPQFWETRLLARICCNLPLFRIFRYLSLAFPNYEIREDCSRFWREVLSPKIVAEQASVKVLAGLLICWLQPNERDLSNYKTKLGESIAKGNWLQNMKFEIASVNIQKANMSLIYEKMQEWTENKAGFTSCFSFPSFNFFKTNNFMGIL